MLKALVLIVATLFTLYFLNIALGLLSTPSDMNVAFGIGMLLAMGFAWWGLFFRTRIKRWKRKLNRMFTFAAIIGLVAAVNSGCATRIGPGYVGIKVDLAGSQRGVQDMPLRTGWVTYAPWSSMVVHYPTFVQTVVWTKNPQEGSPRDESITFTTHMGMSVNADISLSYHLVEKNIPAFYVKFRSDDLEKFTDGFLHNIARDAFNNVGGEYAIEDIMGNNGPFLKKVEAQVQNQVKPFGVIIDQFGFIGTPRPPQSVINSINSKIQAAQIAMQKENEIKQKQADAQKEIAVAQGQAKANQILSNSINDKLIKWQEIQLQYKWISKWNGTLPRYTGGNGTPVPLLQMDGK